VQDYEKIPVGKTCLVIGGGGVAIDCAQHAVRQGAEKVLIACLESWEAMPASLSEREDAREEGIEFFPSLGPQQILGDEGRVTGVEFLKVNSVLDAEGKFNPSFIPDSRTVVKADTVILAVGQSSTLPSLSGLKDLETTAAGLVCAGEDMSTSLPGVFVGGDVRWRSGRNATDAIADGQRGAQAIHGYLSGKVLRVKRKGCMRPLAREFENTRCETIKPADAPKRPVGERIKSREEIALAFEEDEARRQADRCRRCNIQTLFDPSRCLLCGTCVDTCVNRALKMVRMADIQGDGEIEKLVRTTPSPAGRTAIIKDESQCARCGMCARRCPGEALTMAEFHCEEDWE
jgi:ferredoxin